MQVKVRALIRHGDKIVVARESVRGLPRLSLPGGRPRAGEELLEALAREVPEETGLEIHAGRLLYVAESVNGHTVQDLNLVFAAAPVGPLDESALHLVDPRSPEAADVMPPILDTIAEDAAGPAGARWLGNVWRTSRR